MSKTKPFKTISGGLRYKGSIPTPKKGRATSIELEEEPRLIQGEEPDSKEEWYISKGLDILGWEDNYYYHYWVGSPGVRGSQELDFLVLTPGKWTVIDVRGRYWHTGFREDELDIERAVKKNNWRLKVAKDTQITSIDSAVAFLRKEIGER